MTVDDNHPSSTITCPICFFFLCSLKLHIITSMYVCDTDYYNLGMKPAQPHGWVGSKTETCQVQNPPYRSMGSIGQPETACGVPLVLHLTISLITKLCRPSYWRLHHLRANSSPRLEMGPSAMITPWLVSDPQVSARPILASKTLASWYL
ncbi:hypothetical protein V2G26_013756 [Clonostachys chloroleuca]